MLEVKQISKSFHKRIIIRELSFQVKAGEIVCLKGSNGAGKSTTLSMIVGLLRPDQGTIFFEGRNIFQALREYRRQTGYVPQEAAVYEELSGRENLCYWGRQYGLRREKLHHRMERVCAFTGLTAEELGRKVREYSGGMRQRINVGAALLHEPKLLLLDEPTAGMDEHSRVRLGSMLKELSENGTAILYTGHYHDELEELCNRIVDIGQRQECQQGEN